MLMLTTVDLARRAVLWGDARKNQQSVGAFLESLNFAAVQKLPMVIIMGWALSPALNTVIPDWVSLVGGRQSARTLHFVAAFALVAFVLVHVFETIVSGLWNNLRSMLTGNYRVPVAVAEERQHDN